MTEDLKSYYQMYKRLAKENGVEEKFKKFFKENSNDPTMGDYAAVGVAYNKATGLTL